MYHSLSIEESFKKFESSKSGLDESEVKKRQKKYGKNLLAKKGESTSRLVIFLNQWKSPLIIILLVAGVVSGLLGETTDMIIILATAAINAIIGFIQEDKANRALSKLRSLVTYKALVIRSGKKIEIDSEDIVPGDILFLGAGDKVQADGRLIETSELEVREAALTGESEPVLKNTEITKEDKPIADRDNMAYRGTVVTTGEGRMLVTAIGHDTELGKISKLVQETKDEQTPLQVQLGKMSKVIGIFIVIVAFLIVVLGLLVASHEYTFVELFETAVAVAVAAIPEGLVISLTVILAIGMQHILKRKALVRKLVAAETLGSVSVICTDKTGTLTEGIMKVTRIATPNGVSDLSEKLNNDELNILKAATLVNDALHANPNETKDKWKFFGDTTETAILEAAAKNHMLKDELDKKFPRLSSVAFTSDRKFMATLNKGEKTNSIYVKGAPEIVLGKAQKYLKNDKSINLSEKQRDYFVNQIQEMTSKGLRVLAVAIGETKESDLDEKDINELTLLGFIGLSDPVRSDVKKTLQTAKSAGIHVVMITGDNAKTAQTIAKELGLPAEDKNVMEGKEIEGVSEAELTELLKKVHVFARVDPKHKIRIVKAFQNNNHVVAMTGDGVNDAPALKGADIGVALGSGTDVAKEVSDMVLLNDSFSTIVAAIEEGRRIYQNIKKEVLYLMIGSFTEVLLISATLIGRLPLALLPAQILWINIIQEAFPAMALAFDPGDKENMSDPPRPKSSPIFNKEMKSLLVIFTVITNIFLFGLYLYFLKQTGDPKLVRTLMFVGIGVDSLIYIYSIRSTRKYIWQINPFSNKYLTGAVALGWVLLLSSVYITPLSNLLKTATLNASHWLIMIGFGLLTVIVIEVTKSFYIIKSSYLKKH